MIQVHFYGQNWVPDTFKPLNMQFQAQRLKLTLGKIDVYTLRAFRAQNQVHGTVWGHQEPLYKLLQGQTTMMIISRKSTCRTQIVHRRDFLGQHSCSGGLKPIEGEFDRFVYT